MRVGLIFLSNAGETSNKHISQNVKLLNYFTQLTSSNKLLINNLLLWELCDRLSLPQCRVPHLCNSLCQEYDPKQQWRSWKRRARWKTGERQKGILMRVLVCQGGKWEGGKKCKTVSKIGWNWLMNKWLKTRQIHMTFPFTHTVNTTLFLVWYNEKNTLTM